LSLSHVIVLLANEMDASGKLNPESRARADLAALVFAESGADLIIPCGWDYRPDSDLAISDAIASYLSSDAGISGSKIYSERRSRDTVGDAVFTRKDFDRIGLPQKLSVVTTDYHVPRTREIFNFVYGNSAGVSVLGARSDKTPSTKISENASLDAFHKTFAGISPGDFSAIASRMFDEHPFYNGAVHPRFQDANGD
jgi:uncharacterized SAM-binding protein YcdF (DUF218 family)